MPANWFVRLTPSLTRLAILVPLLTSIMLVAVVWSAPRFLDVPAQRPGRIDDRPIPTRFVAGDAEIYTQIAISGYDNNDQPLSNRAYFPLYPAFLTLGWKSLGIAPPLFGVVLSCMCFMLVVMCMSTYIGTSNSALTWTLFCFSCFPASLFFRLAYSESLFLLLEMLMLLGLRKGWPSGWLSLIAALAMLTRPVGIALWVCLLWSRRQTICESTLKPQYRIMNVVKLVIPALVCVGLWCGWSRLYMGTWFPFIDAQRAWQMRWHGTSVWLWKSLLFEPLTSPWNSAHSGFWQYFAPASLLGNYVAWNWIMWVIIVSVLIFGYRRRWLNSEELLLSFLLIAIPYLLQGYRTCFISQARYASMALPFYLLVGRALADWPRDARTLVLVLSTLLLFVFAAQYGAGYYVV